MLRVSDLRQQLNLPPAQDDDGAREEQYILDLRNAAVEYLQRQTGRYFGPLEEVTRLVEGAGTTTLWLPDDLAALSVDAPYPETISAYAYPGADASAIEAAGFIVTPPARVFRAGGAAWLRAELYQLTYWRGYPVGGIGDPYDGDPVSAAALYLTTPESYLLGAPADAQHAVRLIVAHWFTSRLPILSGTITEELPFSLRELIDARRYLFV